MANTIRVYFEALTGSFDTDIQRSARRAESNVKRMQREMRESFRSIDRSLSLLKTAFVGIVSARAIRGVLDISDAYRSVEGRLRIVTANSQELAMVQSELFDTAQRTRSGYEATADIYARVARNSEELGATQREVLEVTEAINKASLIAGATGQEAAAGILQLSQAFASGRLQGDELRSVLENTPRIAKAIADGIGTTIGGLRDLSKAGELTAERVFNALLSQKAVLDREFALLPVTVSQSLKVVENAFRQAIASVDTTELTESIAELARVISDPSVISGLTTVATALVKIADSGIRAAAAYGRFLDRFSNSDENLRERVRFLNEQIQQQGGEGSVSAAFFIRERDQALRDLSGGIELTEGAKETLAQYEAATEAVKALAREILETPAPPTPVDPKELERQQKEAARLQEAIRRASAQAGAEIFQAQQDREEGLLEASYQARLINTEQYLAERLRLTENAIDYEINASHRALQTATIDQQILLKAHIETLEIRRQIAREERSAEEAAKIRELAEAYDSAARSAKSYLDQITRQGQRTLAAFDQTPEQRRFNQGAFQIEDRFIGERERLQEEFASGSIEQQAYDKRLQLLQDSQARELAEYDKYFRAIEAKSKDFNTQFSNTINEYIEGTSNVGEALGITLTRALDDAAGTLSRVGAELILFGEDGREAIYQLARTISTELLSALIRVGIQALINKTLLSAAGGGTGSATGIVASVAGGGFASGGYVGDDPRNRVAGVVHGQEFVINAEATRKNRGLLEAINDGSYSTDAVNIPRTSSQGIKPEANVRVINVPDKSYIRDYLMGSEGDDVFINWVGRNSARIRNAVANG